MANVIDTLVVLLKLDPTQFNEAQKKAVNDFKKTGEAASGIGKEIESAGKRGAQFFVGMRNEALRFAAVLVGFKGFSQFTTDTISAGAATGRLAKNIGETTEEVATLMQAIALNGGDSKAAGASMMALSQSIEELRATGQSPIVPLFNAMGVSLNKASGELKTVKELYEDLADSVKRNNMSAPQANLYLKQVIPDQGSIDAIIMGKEALDNYYDIAVKIGQLTKEQAKSFQDVEKSAAYFGNTLESVGRKWAAWISDRATNFFLSAGIAINDDIVLDVAKSNALNGPKALMDWISEVSEKGERAADAPKSDALPSLFQKLENTPDGRTSSAGAVGRNQIMPDTARQYHFDPARLREPDYNDQVARAIQLALAKKYNGDLDAMAIAYNAGDGRADAFVKNGRDLTKLPRETQKYVAHERALVGGSGATITNIGTINVKGDSAAEVARDIRTELANNALVQQANSGPQ